MGDQDRLPIPLGAPVDHISLARSRLSVPPPLQHIAAIMRHFSPPPGLTRGKFIKGLRDEARENIPPSVYELMSRQVIVVQYERTVLMKQERDVVEDLAQVLPGIEWVHCIAIIALAARPVY